MKLAKKPRRPNGSVLEDHRAGAGDLAGDREALDEPEDHEQHRGEDTDLLVGRQEADADRREAHEEHAHDQHVLAAVGIAPMPEDEGADGPADVADAVGRQRRNDRDRGVPRGEEELREDQRRRRGVDEEVIILQRRADPAAGGRLLRLMSAMRLMFGGIGHWGSSRVLLTR